MVAYPAACPVSLAMQQPELSFLADLLKRRPGETLASIAARHGRSRPAAYAALARAKKALSPQKRGPRRENVVRAHALRQETMLRARISALEEENVLLRGRLADSVFVDDRRRRCVELACFGRNVSLRGTREILEAAYGTDHQPSLDELQARMRWHGLVAGALLDEAVDTVRDTLPCVAADDVYFHRVDVKPIIEPVSNAILDVRRSTGPTTQVWTERLRRFPNLSLLVSDLGGDLCAAAGACGIEHQADYWHEMRIFDDVLSDLSKAEARQRKEASPLRGFEGWDDDRSLGFTARMQAVNGLEDAFFAIAEAQESIRLLHHPIDPETQQLWTPDRIAARLRDTLRRLDAHPGARRIAKHIRTHGKRYTAHIGLFDHIPVILHEGTHWERASVIRGVVRLRGIEQGLADPTQWRNYADFLDRQRLARELRKRLRSACLNFDAVDEAVDRECSRPRRSSSCVESLNNRLRVMQMVHRKVSDEMLALTALRWNLTPRTQPSHRGRSPYEVLGVDWGQRDKRWYEVLLDAESARGLAA